MQSAEKYVLDITPNISTLTFTATVQIHLKLTGNTAEVVLHSEKLTIHTATLAHDDYHADCLVTCLEDTAVFAAGSIIPNGAVLTICYSGVHGNDLAGFYVTKDLNGSSALVTQCQPTQCRRIFPCFDQPNRKASFIVTLNIPPHLTGLANMHVESEQLVTVDGNTLKSLKFAPTPLMSTYIFALAVGEFEYLEGFANSLGSDKIQCRVYTLRGKSMLGEFALGMLQKVLEYFANYYGIAYPLAKLDMLAIPDLSFGAMENWGLVTYRESLLLYDAGKSSAFSKLHIAYTVAHEIAHQWFGNIVTMDWWNDLWLNEGFATFVGWAATHHVFPEWKVWSFFIADETFKGLSLDAMNSSHPIQVDVSSPSQIGEIFDAISYSKGGALIRMLCDFLGPEKFSRGISQYLKKHQYGNANTLDLWSALEECSGQTVSNMMNNWTSVKGYPLVTITHESYDPITKEMTIHVQQSVFLISGSNETDNRLWLIPLSVNSNGKIHRFLFGDKNATFKFPFEDAPGSFYKLNHNCNGFYRTKYPAQALARIKNALIRNINALDTEDRLGVINDMFAVATANCGDFGNEPNSNTVVDALELLSAFQKEDDYNVHLEISSSLLLVKECFYQIPQVINKLHSIAELVFQEAINRLGVIFCEDDEFLVEMDRALAISTLASAKDKQIVTMLCKIVQEIKPEKMPSSLRGIALRTFLQNSNAPNADFDMMVNIMTSCKSVDIRQSVMGALGAINSLDVTRRLLGMLIDDNFVKSQEIMLCLSAIVSHNPCAGAKELLWEWMITNWDLLHEKLSSSNILLKRLVLLCAAGRLGREFIDTVRNWSLAKHCTNENDKQKLLKQVQGAASGIEQSLERISIKTDWFERDSARLLQWANKV